MEKDIWHKTSNATAGASDETSYDVFISYRRDGGRDAARLLYKELAGRGLKCFFDFNSLRSGKFDDKIFEAIKGCRHFVLMVTDGAFERCDNSDDWVRTEIEFALKNEKDIIPVAPSDQQQCFPAGLPESMVELRRCEISELNMGKLFERSVDQIIEDRFDAKYASKASVALTGTQNRVQLSKWQQLMAFTNSALKGEQGAFVKRMVQIVIAAIVLFFIAAIISGIIEAETEEVSMSSSRIMSVC